MAVQLNLYVEQGATFERSMLYTDTAGEPVDLEDFTALMQLRTSVDATTETLEVVPAINAELGEISWEFTSTQTNSLTASSYVYALELYGPDDLVIRFIEGTVTVSPRVVR